MNIAQWRKRLALWGSIGLTLTSCCGAWAQSGTATLSWTPPTQNTDGSPLTDLTSYRVYWGTGNGYPFNVTIPAPATGYVVEGLTQDTWRFAVTAISSQNGESAYSNEAIKSILEPVPEMPTIGPTVTWSEATGPTLTTNASAVPGGQITVTISGAPGGPTDWVSVVAVGAANQQHHSWTYVGSGVTSRTWVATVPWAPGQYDVRLLVNDSYTDIARSAPFTVQ